MPQQAKRQIARQLFDLVKQDLEELAMRKVSKGE